MIARQLLGTLVVAGSVVLASTSIFELVRIGTCGAPPGAVAIRACPEGTGVHVLLMIASLFVLPFVGAWIARSMALAIGWWCVVWIAMGSASIVAGHGPAASPEASGADAVAITFLAIGGLSALGALFTARLSSGPRIVGPPRPTVRRPVVRAATISANERAELDELDALARTAAIEERLRTVDALRAAGTITDAEHAARRRAILDEI